MALILNIETATEVCSVALAENGKLLSLQEENKSNSHSSVLTILIQQAFETSGRRMDEMDAVAVSAGPGSFTGLRIGASTAKGLCYALDIPLLAVPTLKAMAKGMIETVCEQKALYCPEQKALYCPVMDSIKDEVFAGLYTAALDEVAPASPQDTGLTNLLPVIRDKFFFVCGNGAVKLSISHPSVVNLDISNSAKHLIKLSQQLFNEKSFNTLETFEPQYLKNFIPVKRF